MPPDRPIRLFVVDDHALFCEGLTRLLAADPAFALVGFAGTADAALAALPGLDVDVLLLDYLLGDQPSGPLLSALREQGFLGRVLLVTAGLPDREALRMIGGGVAGIFHKQHAVEDLKRTLREVFDGKVLIEEHYLRKLAQAASLAEPRAPQFTDRERQILAFLVEGLANKEIAAALHLSESAVKAALQVLFNRTSVRTRSQLVRVALEHLRAQG